jgi:hypothetical protein
MVKELFCSLLVVFSMFFSEGFSQGFLRTSGKYIVNDNGEFLLRGIGIGGWLVQEGYMFHMSGFANSPTEIHNKIVDIAGETNADQFYKLFRANFFNRDDVVKIKNWGFNSIRLPLHYKDFVQFGQQDVYLEEGFKLVDSVLAWCRDNQIYLILDLHCAPGAQNTGNISDSDGEARLWTSPAFQTRTVNLWQKFADRYKDEQWIGGYDLINETAYNLGTNNVPLRNLMVNITTAIRKVDTHHIVFVEGNWYATDFSGLTPPWDNNMAYSFHKYWNGMDQGSIQYLLDIRNNFNVPLWCGESGENSNSWFYSVITLFEDNKIGWSWWSEKKFASTNTLLNVPITPEFQALLNYWDGKTTVKPAPATATMALNGMAMNSLAENCQEKTDMLDAMFRQVKTPTAVPFKDNTLPGKIFFTDYDLGPQGLCYKDNEFVCLKQGDPWNQGGEYRNDGVDIEKCTDGVTNGYNVGWIETGEWMKYTINVPEDASYDVTVRYAAPSSGGKITLNLDSKDITSAISLPATGGNQTWKTARIANIALSKGTHSLYSRITSGGYNLNYMEFVKTSVGVEDKPVTPSEFKVGQNYPNPFNPQTNIKFSLEKESQIKIKIYDSRGTLVSTLLNGRMSAGEHSVVWNAAGAASGVYFYTVETAGLREIRKAILLK